ncbi:hypothetical protein [Bacillus sp. ISL-7]|uniref:hypothetical protein n=1 Tax=Bacillus sp. ISL-7 TaxID=2819136 RepID=UPI001BEC50F3|nr:hypothetical protein [Bacillus sp. ISL-7]MBT2738588.1 hypothetical protein [Bacillus sp. ISL-7]
MPDMKNITGLKTAAQPTKNGEGMPSFAGSISGGGESPGATARVSTNSNAPNNPVIAPPEH